MSLIEDAKATKAYLLEHGWRQREAYDDDGKCCLLGAVDRALGDVNKYDDLTDALARFRGLDEIGHLIDWNDEPGRTADEVVALLDEYIREAA